MQRTLIATVKREARSRLQSGDIPLAQGIGVLPQGKDRQLLQIEVKANPLGTASVVQHGESLALFVSVRHNIVDRFVVIPRGRSVVLPIAKFFRRFLIEGRDFFNRCSESRAWLQKRWTKVAVIKSLV